MFGNFSVYGSVLESHILALPRRHTGTHMQRLAGGKGHQSHDDTGGSQDDPGPGESAARLNLSESDGNKEAPYCRQCEHQPYCRCDVFRGNAILIVTGRGCPGGETSKLDRSQHDHYDPGSTQTHERENDQAKTQKKPGHNDYRLQSRCMVSEVATNK